MSEYSYFNLRERPELKEVAANWFHEKWGVPTEAYKECIDAYIDGTTEYGWYLCLDEDKNVEGLGEGKIVGGGDEGKIVGDPDEEKVVGDFEEGKIVGGVDKGKIVAGLGVIDNDFHDRKDLTPNVCAVYTEESYRCQGISGKLLNMVVDDMKSKGITPIYLVTDHVGFYERYGWEFFCMAQGDGEPEPTRLYIHR